MIQQLNNTNFQKTINDNNVVLVDFYADWCGPCQRLQPTLENISSELEGKAVISKINVDNNLELSQQFGIRSVPAIFYFKNGKLVDKQNGVQSKDSLLQNLNYLLNE